MNQFWIRHYCSLRRTLLTLQEVGSQTQLNIAFYYIPITGCDRYTHFYMIVCCLDVTILENNTNIGLLVKILCSYNCCTTEDTCKQITDHIIYFIYYATNWRKVINKVLQTASEQIFFQYFSSPLYYLMVCHFDTSAQDCALLGRIPRTLCAEPNIHYVFSANLHSV